MQAHDPLSLTQTPCYPPALVVSSALGATIHGLFNGIEGKKNREQQVKLKEVEHNNRLTEQAKRHDQILEEQKHLYEHRVVEAFINSGLRINEHRVIEMLRSSYAIHNTIATRQAAKADENSPFLDDADTTYKMLKALHEETCCPIVLVAPFWDDTRPRKVNKEGGFVDFRSAFNFSYSAVPWSAMACKQDGYLERPLFYTDRDVRLIQNTLHDIPVILVHGTIQGTHAPGQSVQRIHPHVTVWNFLPTQEQILSTISLQFFPFKLPVDPSPMGSQLIGQYSLGLQDAVGQYLARIIGILASSYHLYHFGTRPNLRQFQSSDDLSELEPLTLQMSSLYKAISQNEPRREVYYCLDEAIMLAESGISKEAIWVAKKSLYSWLKIRMHAGKSLLEMELEIENALSKLRFLEFAEKLTSEDHYYIMQIRDFFMKIGDTHLTSKLNEIFSSWRSLKIQGLLRQDDQGDTLFF